jgi:rfaE bifunctional protein kinase chain/domain
VSPGRLTEILDAMRRVRIAVCGDFCLDAYWIMDARGSEVSVETGLQARAVGRHYYSPGGAGNVVANLASLQPAALRVIGVLGDDLHGRELRAQLDALGADTSGLIVQPEDFDTYTYLKRISDGAEEPRLDFGVFNRRSEASDRQMLAHLRDALERSDVLIFNQQVRGSIAREEFFEEVNRLFAGFADKIILLDSRHFNRRFRGVYRKTNDVEIAGLCGVELPAGHNPSIAELTGYGRSVYEREGRPVFVTCGDRGILAFDATGERLLPGLHLTGPLDPVGAGDTVISALGLCLGAGIAPAEAAEVANLAAAVTVQKLYTTGTAGGRNPGHRPRSGIYLRARPRRRPAAGPLCGWLPNRDLRP